MHFFKCIIYHYFQNEMFMQIIQLNSGLLSRELQFDNFISNLSFTSDKNQVCFFFIWGKFLKSSYFANASIYCEHLGKTVWTWASKNTFAVKLQHSTNESTHCTLSVVKAMWCVCALCKIQTASRFSRFVWIFVVIKVVFSKALALLQRNLPFITLYRTVEQC